MKQVILRFQIAVLAILGVITLFSCTKTEEIDYQKDPQNKIVEFKITNSQQQLLAAIDQEKNTINVYIPYYLGLDMLVPAIKLDKGAKLIDDKGDEINLDGGIDPIWVGTEATYRVKGEDNTIRTYKLTQQFLPFNTPLQAGYTKTAVDTNPIESAPTYWFYVYGNFASTSTYAKFTFTDKQSGKVYKDFTNIVSVAPSADTYTMTVALLPEAMAGEYKVEVEHQGRKTQLPDMKIVYRQPFPTFFNSSIPKTYHVGDTLSIIPNAFGAPSGQGVYVELDRVYLKFEDVTKIPATFPASLMNTEIPVKVVSQTRREVKLLMPDLPLGQYQIDGNQMIMYFDYNHSFGKDIRTVVINGNIEIKAKAN